MGIAVNRDGVPYINGRCFDTPLSQPGLPFSYYGQIRAIFVRETAQQIYKDRWVPY